MTPGDTITVENWPFVLEEVELPPDDPEADSFVTVKSWRPGCNIDDGGPEDSGEYVADGIGAMLLTIISTHRPGRYPERVFYVRQWRDPDGKVFGKTSLRVLSRWAFTRMARGYRHSFECDALEVPMI